MRKEDAENRLVYPDFQVVLPKRLQSGLAGVKVLDRAGKSLYEFSGNLPSHSFLPEPAEMAETFVVADCPRLVPPPWGATPPPPNNRLHPETSGWDTTNDAPDAYVFIPGEGGYAKLREDFLALLGGIPDSTPLDLWVLGQPVVSLFPRKPHWTASICIGPKPFRSTALWSIRTGG